MNSNQSMEKLLPIRVNEGNKVVNARHLHAFLEIGKDFSTWIKVQIQRCDLVENVDFQPLTQKGERLGNGRFNGSNKIEYALSIEAAKEIAMMSQTPKGKMARRYFIECERRLLTRIELGNYLRIDEFCRLYGKSTRSFYGLMSHYRREFIVLGNLFYISKRLAQTVGFKTEIRNIRLECREDERYEQLLLPFVEDF